MRNSRVTKAHATLRITAQQNGATLFHFELRAQLRVSVATDETREERGLSAIYSILGGNFATFKSREDRRAMLVAHTRPEQKARSRGPST